MRACYEVILMSPDGGEVTAYGGWGVTRTVAVADVHALDVVMVPGVINLEHARRTPAIVDAVRVVSSRSALTASVCTGAFLLADAGLFAGLPATTHWEDIPALAERTARQLELPWNPEGTIPRTGS